MFEIFLYKGVLTLGFLFEMVHYLGIKGRVICSFREWKLLRSMIGGRLLYSCGSFSRSGLDVGDFFKRPMYLHRELPTPVLLMANITGT